MKNREHNVQKAMMHLEKASMYFGGQQLSGMERMTHDTIIRYSEKLGPVYPVRHKVVIGPVAPSQPSSFEFDVYGTEEQNSTKAHLDEDDIFHDGFQYTAGFNDRSLIGKFSLDYVITTNHVGVHTHCITLTWEHDQPQLARSGYPFFATASWEVDPHSRLPYNQAVIRQDRSSAIAKILQTAQSYGCQHPQCNVEARHVDLYLKKTS